jgi:hypothetical protein
MKTQFDRPLVPINSMDELKKILFIQKTVTEQAKNEMLAVGTDGAGNPKAIPAFIAEERKLLTKYANYPTMSEMSAEPDALMNGTKWGATFGVAILVGGLIVEELKRMQPHLEPVLRHMLLLLLDELNHPRHKYLVEPMERSLTITSKAAPGKEQAIKRQVCTDLANAIIAVGQQYGIVSVKKGGTALTPLGKRVFLHMVDAQRFVQEMGTAHVKFQTAKPKLSMS